MALARSLTEAGKLDEAEKINKYLTDEAGFLALTSSESRAVVLDVHCKGYTSHSIFSCNIGLEVLYYTKICYLDT